MMQQRKPLIPLSIKLFALFIGVPFIELLLLIQISEWTSLGFTLLLIIVSGIIGASMAKAQGLRVWRAANEELRGGKFPAESLIDGIIILVGGALLLTPGVLTDIVGFSTLIPQTRVFWRLFVKIYFANKVARAFQPGQSQGGFRVYQWGSQQGPAGFRPPQREQEAEQEREEVQSPRSSGTMPKGSPFEDQSPFAKKH